MRGKVPAVPTGSFDPTTIDCDAFFRELRGSVAKRRVALG
jgi:hypothetical protein